MYKIILRINQLVFNKQGNLQKSKSIYLEIRNKLMKKCLGMFENVGGGGVAEDVVSHGAYGEVVQLNYQILRHAEMETIPRLDQ